MAIGLLGLAAVTGLQAGTADSVTVHRRAREAQADFERFRRAHLPFTPPAGGRFEERIGRFRYWHDDGQAPPPAEHARVREARQRLLATLESAALVIPGDGWIAGELVRYLIEHGSRDGAVSAAHRCAAAPWWCRALEGLARHAQGDFGGAEHAFDAALHDMPQEQRCRWTDASLLLEGSFRGQYRRPGCAERAPLDERLWWLARPLFLLPGNDRRTEHFARQVMSEIERDARNAYGIRWGNDLAEITVRYGWVTAWSAESPRYGGMDEPGVIGHQRSPGFHFVPTSVVLAEPYAADSGAWELRFPAPPGAYAPAYADSFVALPHQVAQFRRGDSTLVVASYDLTQDPGFHGRPLEAALVLSGGPRGETVITRSRAASGQLVATIGQGAFLVGIEALSRESRRAARTRYALPLPVGSRVNVSDLLLLEPVDSLPTALHQALPHVLPSANLAERRRIVLFWEAYGLNPSGELVAVSLSVRRTREGVLRRAARTVGLAGRSHPVRLEWHESPQTTGPGASRALLLDLSALSPGAYRIELTVDVAEQDPVTVTRDVRLGRAPPGERAFRH
jgi:hypothetical protein